ncbi:DUF7672 family protein [Winogradskyella ouciana]|uniref:Uncharacterized protein n=1 Tax=Winogradskyella ouciana TaxID=2608631 RepID=A0A7K1GBR4_9FLAO|nr:hypothetical protein [Winogradskyella ouciana]MTE26732.1 hypothetical protein [Winogradskyella ouciana]
MIRIYIIGLAILIIAIIANGIVVKLGLKSWYDFINLLTDQGISALKEISIIDYFWLLIGYPLVLGLGYYLGDKLYMLLFT